MYFWYNYTSYIHTDKKRQDEQGKWAERRFGKGQLGDFDCVDYIPFLKLGGEFLVLIMLSSLPIYCIGYFAWIKCIKIKMQKGKEERILGRSN